MDDEEDYPMASERARRGSFGMEPDFAAFTPHHWRLRNFRESAAAANVSLWKNDLDLPKYEYEPLNGGSSQIRLLKIISFDNPARKVVLSLEVHSLYETCPGYQALSYTWGCPTDDGGGGHADGFAIECDGRSIAVTSNLHAALVQLARNKTTGYIWADALCIDQKNPDEKTHQVQIMHEIYGRAALVIVWLGDVGEDMEPFLESIYTLGDILRSPRIRALGTFHPFDEELVKQIGVSSVEEWGRLWNSYFKFYKRRRWFRRAWIVQEVALARKLIFWCGPTTIEWEFIYEIGLMLRATGWRHIVAASNGINSRGGVGDEADRLLEYRKQVAAGGPEDPSCANVFKFVDGATTPRQRWVAFFQYMAQEIRRYDAEDPKDHMYAILGIVDSFLPIESENPIKPVYTIPVGEVYVNAAKLFLTELPNLSCLSYIQDKSRGWTTGLPSWVPDFRLSLGRPPFTRLGDGNIFNASGTCDNNVKAWDTKALAWEANILILTGTHISTIVDTAPPMDMLHRDYYLFPYFDLIRVMHKRYKFTNQSRVEALWRTLITDTTHADPDVHPVDADYGYNFRCWVLSMLPVYYNLGGPGLKRTAFLEDQLASLQDLRREPGKNLPSDEEIREAITTWHTPDGTVVAQHSDPFNQKSCAYLYDHSLRRIKPDRRLFKTEHGHLGLGPKSLSNGDEIWLLKGARVPFVLRHVRDSNFQIVGEAYVHGIMHGEALSGEVEWKDVAIL